jgi:hypothetical protein
MSYLNRRVVFGAFGVTALLLLVTFFVIFGFSGETDGEADVQLAALTVIPGPTSTPKIPATPTYDPLQGTPTPLAGEIAVHGFVQIGGTEGEGLRLRETPGLNGKPLFLGFDAEVFQVADGPEDVDGYRWWYLKAPYDDTRSGWAVADFLEAIPSP